MHFFFAVWRKLRKAQQKTVALIAVAFKSPISISKTNAGLSGRKLYAGHIHRLFCIFLLIYPPIGIKKVRNRSHAPKNANPDCCYTKPDNWDIGYPTYHLLEFAFLPNSKSGMPKKGIISPLKRPLSHKSIIWFCVANLLYHRICKTSSGWVKKIICIK